MLKKGLYYTVYGNTCRVSGPLAKSAWDIDAGQRIPISLVGKPVPPQSRFTPGVTCSGCPDCPDRFACDSYNGRQ